MPGLRRGHAAGRALLGDLLPPDLPFRVSAHHCSQHGLRAGVWPVRGQSHGAVGPLHSLAGMENASGHRDAYQGAGVAPYALGAVHGVGAHRPDSLRDRYFEPLRFGPYYMRLNGARLGRGVYINSLAVNDHDLLEFGDRVVIGDGVHLSGHTVEHGIVRTARVRLGDDVTIGLGTVVGIGVEAGARCQVGALSLVSKFSLLKSDATYVGAPVREAVHLPSSFQRVGESCVN